MAALATDLAGRAVALADGRVARVGVDGAADGDTLAVGDAVATAVTALGRPVLRVRAADYLRPRSVRLEHGAEDAETGYDRWVDHLALRREVLDPLGPGGSGWWLPTLWDRERDRATRETVRDAVPGSVLVLDGPFLLRWETADALDLSVHLTVSDAALARRVEPGDVTRATGAWALYEEQTWPADRADVVVRYERPARPAVRVGPAG